MAEPLRSPPRAVIFGLSGPAVTEDERVLFAEANPLGFILFTRNCVEPAQVRDLCADLRQIVGRDDAPILIDQEGGRVARLRPPHWPLFPPAADFGALARSDLSAATDAARLNAQLIAHELASIGIDVDCLPVVDVPQPDADGIIGDRAFADDPDIIVAMARAVCEGLHAGGVSSVLKHIPGHGRARVDSHKELPVVETPRTDLDHVDFAPFRDLAQMPWAPMPWGMTAHVVYSALDPDRPATTSAQVIDTIIRGAIGFDGVLVSDDLCMKALSGDPGDLALAALNAGCDIALHCDGNFRDMESIAAVCPLMTPMSQARLQRSQARRSGPGAFDAAAARSRRDQLLAGAAA